MTRLPMKTMLVTAALALAGCGEGALGRVVRNVTAFPRSTFTNPGDVLALSPTVDSGIFGTDGNSDCSTCPPR